MAAIIAAKSTFRSRTFSTPTTGYNSYAQSLRAAQGKAAQTTGGFACALPKDGGKSPRRKGGYSPNDRCLHFYWRGLSRYALPFSVWHFHPRIGPALVSIKRLTRRIGPLAFETSGGNGGIPESGDLHIVVLGTAVFHRFRHG